MVMSSSTWLLQDTGLIINIILKKYLSIYIDDEFFNLSARTPTPQQKHIIWCYIIAETWALLSY